MARSRGRYRLTVRDGSAVSRERFDDLDAALERMAAEVESIRAGGGLPRVKMIRSFEPADRVAGRIEVSTAGALGRGRSDAGIDVMGDGRLIAYSGGLRRRELEPAEGESELDAVRRALEG